MSKGYLKNSIISLILTISFIVMPLSFIPKKTKAQSINTYIGGLSEVITQLPLCQDKAVDGIKGLFDGAQTWINNKTANGPYSETLIDTNSDALSEYESIPVELSRGVTEDIEVTRANTEETKKSVQSLDESDTCLKSIGRAVAKMLLQKITMSTVEWINGGYDGSPKFIQNAGEFWGDMAKNEIIQFGVEINNPELFPFGQAFMQNQAIAFKTKFAQNAEYSLNKLIQNTNPQFSATTFEADFSQGGWEAWTYMTQVPANNPLGFNLMASNELQKRLEGTSQSKAQEIRANLQQAGGYLGTEMCTYPDGVDREEHENALKERIESPSYDSNGNPIPVAYQNRLCERWEYVTPGGMVADAATKLVNYPDNNLLRVDDLNDAVAAILDAMLNSFIPEINSDSGFAYLSDSEYYQSALEGNYVINEDAQTTFNDSWTSLDYPGFQIASSSFLRANPNFNIRTDLTQALIDEQRIFVEKLKEQNKELNSKDDLIQPTAENGFFTGNYGLIPTIYQLDYCIPGPHPGFEKDSRDALSAALSVIVPEDINTVKNKSTDELLGMVEDTVTLAAAAVGMVVGGLVLSWIPVIGTIVGAVVGAIIGYIVGAVIDLFSNNEEEKIKAYYGSLMYNFTGVQVDYDDKDDDLASQRVAALHNKRAFSGALNKILDRYIKIIYDVYKPELLPSVTPEATQKYKQQHGYIQMYKNNEERIVSMKGIIKRLEGIKEEIDRLNCEVDDNPQKTGCTTFISQEDYNDGLKPWINAFGRISAELVNGDDIAAVENTIKQIVDEKDYIYNDLLKGPNGCEKELETGKGLNGPGLPWQIYDTKRMTYPGSLLYDYNNWNNTNKHTINLPDPFNSGYTENKMAIGTDINNYGPGFLSYVVFEDTENNWCGDNYTGDTQNGVEGNHVHAPLCLQDLFELGKKDEADKFGLWTAFVGRFGGGEKETGIFEIMIGVF